MVRGRAVNPGQSAAFSADAEHGGICFGDSGGPILDYGTHTIWMVNSLVINRNCTGVGAGYRIDRADDLAFLADVTTGVQEFQTRREAG